VRGRQLLRGSWRSHAAAEAVEHTSDDLFDLSLVDHFLIPMLAVDRDPRRRSP